MSNKEESLLPSVYDFIKEAGSRSVLTKEYIESLGPLYHMLIEQLIKDYGEKVRRITLEVAAINAKVEMTSGSSDPSDDYWQIKKSSITDLNNSPKLEVR